MRLEPIVRPSAVVTNEPLAWDGKATWATAVTTRRVEDAGDEGQREQERDGGPELVAEEGGHRSVVLGEVEGGDDEVDQP